MPRKRPTKNQAPHTPVQSKDDIAELDSFCRGFNHVEIAFEHWHLCHSSLNLSIPVFLTKSELIIGVEKAVNFSRTITDECGRVRREAASVIVSIPPSTVSGHAILLREQGDRLGSLAGDLVITLQLK